MGPERKNNAGGAREAVNNRGNSAGGAIKVFNNRSNSARGTREGIYNMIISAGGRGTLTKGTTVGQQVRGQ